MADWILTLKIKDLFESGEGEDYDLKAIQNAPIVVKRIEELISRAEKMKGVPRVAYIYDRLMEGLEEVVDGFKLINDADFLKKWDEDGSRSPKDEFNAALSLLYDVGDERHAVWVF